MRVENDAGRLGLKNLGNTCYVSWVDESRCTPRDVMLHRNYIIPLYNSTI